MAARRGCTVQPPPSRDEGGGVSTGAIVGGAAILGIVAFLASRPRHDRGPDVQDRPTERGDRPANADDLVRDGPQIATEYPDGTFAVRGFSKDNWPVVLDYKPEPRTRTTLDVIYGKNRVTSIVVDTNGLEGRHRQLVVTPGYGWAKRATPATYVLRSATTDEMGREVAPAKVEVFGIGGGPRAVGSVAIEEVHFGPPLLRSGTAASFQYHAKSPFDRTQTEVMRFERNGATIRLSQMMGAAAQDVAIGTHRGRWDGREKQRAVAPPGNYRFQVRGWFTSDEKSWVGAVADNLVTVR